MAVTETASTGSASSQTVAIIGGGVAGLAAALELLKSSSSWSPSDNSGTESTPIRLRIIILEARNRLGGRIHTHIFKNSKLNAEGDADGADLGASFIHGIHDNPLTELSKEIPFDLYLPPESSSSRYLSTRDAHGHALSHSEADRLDFITFSAVFARLRTFAQEGSHPALGQEVSMFYALTSQDDAFRQALWPYGPEDERMVQAARNFMGLWAGWTGAPLDQVAAKWWGFEREYEGEDAVLSKGGYGTTLVPWYERQIRAGGGEIALNQEVLGIKDVNEDGVISIDIRDRLTGEMKATQASRVICTLPLGVLKHRILTESSPALFEPALPARRLDAIRRLGNGLLDKIVLRYETAWWRDSSLSDEQRNPQILLCPSSVRISPDGTLADVEMAEARYPSAIDELRNGPLFVYDYDVVKSEPTLMAFIPPPLAEALEAISDEEAGQTLHERLVASIRRATHPRLPTESILTRWRQDPFSRGSYSYLRVAQPAQRGDPATEVGSTPLDFDELSRPLWEGRLGFAGEHCHADCYASVHGALLSGQREATRQWSELRRLHLSA
ncbi:hypothetical protein V8E36_006302 [Tilletia maclaganii]